MFRVSRVQAAELLDEPSCRPESFDLPRFWAQHCAEFLATVPGYWVDMRVAPAAAWRLAHLSVKGGVYAADVSQDDTDDWVRMRVDLETRDIACETLLAYGPDVEVLTPAELRDLVASRARSTVAVYDADG